MASDADDTEFYIEMALWIGAAIAAYYVWTKVSAGVSSVTAPVVDAAADAYVALTSGGAASAAGNVILPDGSSVPVSSINPVANSDGSTTFSQDGATYTIQPGTDSNGDWTATD
jgi:hypothetical protein